MSPTDNVRNKLELIIYDYHTIRTCPRGPWGGTGSENAVPNMLQPLPPHLEEAIHKVGMRGIPSDVQTLIAELCDIRPYSRAVLAELLGRTPKWIYQNYLKPMIRDGVLELTIPNNPRSPKQAYRTRSRKEDT